MLRSKVILFSAIILIGLVSFFIYKKGCHMSSHTTPLIPRNMLFGNPDRTSVSISPDGKWIGYIAPRNGVLNVWILNARNLSEAPLCLTNDTHRGIRSYFWAHDHTHILYLQDRDGDENWRLFKVDISSQKATPLVDLPKVRVDGIVTDYRHPNVVIIGINDRDPRYHDQYRLNINTGERTLLYKNDDFIGFIYDNDLNLRFAIKMSERGEEYFQRTKDGWAPYRVVNAEDRASTSLLGFNKDNSMVYWVDSTASNFARLIEMNPTNPKEYIVIEEPKKTDISGAFLHPTEFAVLWAKEEYLKPEKRFHDLSVQKEFDYLASLKLGIPEINDTSLDFNTWIIRFWGDDVPTRYYLYNRPTKTLTFLFYGRADFKDAPLVSMNPVEIITRDGLIMVCYLSLPKESFQKGTYIPKHPLPLVLNVHGGPQCRDNWGIDIEHQWLANRGYAVLSVNYRGSSGFGKKFVAAGDLEWGRKMQEDLYDAVDWAIHNKIADPHKIAIFGGSYGGYAVLSALTTNSEKFACGVDIVGPSSLATFYNSMPAYWKPIRSFFHKKIGNPQTPEGKRLFKERSPLTYAHQIKRPLLIAQGANDPRVTQVESDQIVSEMKKLNIPVTYVLYADEGHGFARPENRLSFYAVAEQFLADNLGGRCEPINNDFKGSSVLIKEGVVKGRP